MEDQPKLLLRCIQRMNAMIAMLIRQRTPYSRDGMIFLRIFCRFIVQVSGLCSTDGVVTAINIGRRALLVVRTCRCVLPDRPTPAGLDAALCTTEGNEWHDQGLCFRTMAGIRLMPEFPVHFLSIRHILGRSFARDLFEHLVEG